MKQLIDTVLHDTNYHGNPFFRALNDGSFAKEDFVETQIQCYFAVLYFSRPLAMMAAKIENPEHRLKVLRNAWDEHGEGDLAQSHGVIFRELLARLGGLTREDIDRRAMWPETRTFNTLLAGACSVDEYLVSASMVGIMERMFCDISGWIGRGIVNRGWLEPGQVLHYNLHETLDIRHAQDFFDIVEPAWQQAPESRYYIEQGMRLGATLFNGLYHGLYQNRTRRLFRDISGPHMRT
jgi:pyrroloquinoline quinone (PQQ) biosynthesis protein C